MKVRGVYHTLPLIKKKKICFAKNQVLFEDLRSFIQIASELTVCL